MAELPQNEHVQIRLVGFRDRRGRFAPAEAATRKQMRQTAKDAVGDLKKLAVKLSPEGKHPFGTPSGYVHFKDAWETSYSERDDGADATLVNTSKHAGVVMFDTPQHVVKPKHAHALRFMGHDRHVHFTRGPVTIPAHKGNPVLEKALEQGQSSLEAALQKAAGKVSIEIQHIFE